MKDEQKSAANMNYALRSDRQSLTMQVNWSIDFSTNKPRSVWIMSKRDDQLQKGTCLSTKWGLMSSWQAPWIVWLVWEKSVSSPPLSHCSLWSSRGQRYSKGCPPSVFRHWADQLPPVFSVHFHSVLKNLSSSLSPSQPKWRFLMISDQLHSPAQWLWRFSNVWCSLPSTGVCIATDWSSLLLITIEEYHPNRSVKDAINLAVHFTLNYMESTVATPMCAFCVLCPSLFSIDNNGLLLCLSVRKLIKELIPWSCSVNSG